MYLKSLEINGFKSFVKKGSLEFSVPIVAIVSPNCSCKSKQEAEQDAARRARPVILEPIMKVEVTVPEKFFGDITGNLSGKRGMIEGFDDRPGGLKIIRTKVPLSEMFGFTDQLRSMTEGRGSASMEFSHYAIVPPNVEKTIVEARK